MIPVAGALAKPVWMWAGFLALVAALMAFDLGILHRDGSKEISVRHSLLLSAFYIAMGLAFGAWVWWSISPQAGLEYVTGFVIEKSLSMYNIFVIAMIFGFFGITDVRFVRAEGVAMGPDAKAAALASADVEISSHTSVAANQARVSQVA